MHDLTARRQLTCRFGDNKCMNGHYKLNEIVGVGAAKVMCDALLVKVVGSNF